MIIKHTAQSTSGCAFQKCHIAILSIFISGDVESNVFILFVEVTVGMAVP